MPLENYISSYSPNTICIGWVSPGNVENIFCKSLSTVILQNPEIITDIVTVDGNVLTVVRNVLIDTFLKNTNTEWLLMIDSDVGFSSKDIHELLEVANQEKAKVVSGVLFLQRAAWDSPVLEPGIVKFVDEHNIETIWNFKKESTFEIDGGSLGFVLVHRDVLLDMNDERSFPWFFQNEENQVWQGEDITFFRRVKEKGYKVFATSKTNLHHVKKFALNKNMYN
jgi:hypothetical protein